MARRESELINPPRRERRRSSTVDDRHRFSRPARATTLEKLSVTSLGFDPIIGVERVGRRVQTYHSEDSVPFNLAAVPARVRHLPPIRKQRVSKTVVVSNGRHFVRTSTDHGNDIIAAQTKGEEVEPPYDTLVVEDTDSMPAIEGSQNFTCLWHSKSSNELDQEFESIFAACQASEGDVESDADCSTKVHTLESLESVKTEESDAAAVEGTDDMDAFGSYAKQVLISERAKAAEATSKPAIVLPELPSPSIDQKLDSNGLNAKPVDTVDATSEGAMRARAIVTSIARVRASLARVRASTLLI